MIRQVEQECKQSLRCRRCGSPGGPSATALRVTAARPGVGVVTTWVAVQIPVAPDERVGGGLEPHRLDEAVVEMTAWLNGEVEAKAVSVGDGAALVDNEAVGGIGWFGAHAFSLSRRTGQFLTPPP